MENFSLETTLKNGLRVELYMNTYGTNYCITVFTPDYKAIETKRTSDYFLALHKMRILENKYSKKQ